MRFVSKYLNYAHSVRPGRFMVLQDGQRQELTRELFVEFVPAPRILSEDEIEFGIKNLNHHGLPIDRNTETHFSPRHRLSGFDTVEAALQQDWTDEERQIVEQSLLSSPHFGQDFLQLPEAPVEKPWATYDTTPGQKVIGLARDLGIDLEQVLAYEKQNRNDAGLVYLLEQEIAAAPEADASEEEDAPVVIEA